MSKRNIYILLVISIVFTFTSCKCKVLPDKESANESFKKIGENPYYAINEKQIDQNAFVAINPDSIASLSIIYGKEAIDKFGKKGKDGAITLLTNGFARSKYESYFKSKSEKYEIMKRKYHENEIQYIVNKKVLKQDNYGELLRYMEEDILKRIIIIDSLELKQKYYVLGKKIGVIIKSKHNYCE